MNLATDKPDVGPVATFAALADETRWAILCAVGERAQSASELAARMPVSRQAIAAHLTVLEQAGLVESARESRHLRYRAVGGRLSALARDLDVIGRAWERRLDRLAALAERRAD